MKLEVKNKLGEVYYIAQYNEANGSIETDWYGYVSAEEVIQAVQQLMDTFAGARYTLCLNDSSKAEGSWDEANEWLASNWMPNAIASGLQKFAFVVSPDIFSAMSSEDLATKIPGTGIEMRTFKLKKEAGAWLASA